ncbi:MAG: hypothetical protein SFW09_10895 [Hyphomicrobiaceae bacterium]|nr:hypothetical protein [Hyphomicrobiaceae bacterium]
MDVLGWIWWLLASALGLVWSLIWFLLGGWVSTLAQIAVIVLVVFGMKYGWRRAPNEMLARLGAFSRFGWAWLRSKPPPATAPQATVARAPHAPRGRPRRQPGDVRINISTLLSLLMIAGLGMLAAL